MANYRALVAQTAKKYGIPEALAMRWINQESGFNPRAGSNKGAQGLGQLMPGTARGLGVKNVWDPVENINASMRYLLGFYNKYHRWDYALAAYNAGGGAVDKYHGIPPYRETQGYVRNILGGRQYAAPGQGHGDIMTGNTSTEQPSHQQAPAENPHAYSDFAMSLINATKNHSAEAMLGAIMNLRRSLQKPQPVSQPKGVDVAGPTGGGMTGGSQSPLNELIRAEKIAKQMGLRASENYNLGGVAPGVHVPTSFHYRKYPGTNVGRAIDVTGTPQQMSAYARRILQLGGSSELFYDPLGGWKYGKSIGPIGGHRTHVHVAY